VSSHILETHIVPTNVAPIRLSNYAAGIFTAIPSRKGMKKAILRGEVLINGEVAQTGTWVNPEQKIELIEPEQKPQKVFRLDFEVLFEDGFLAVVNKPAGIKVSGNQFQTMENALPNCLTPSKEKDALKKMRPVHRLDAATSGLLLVAKTARAHISLGQQFENKSIRKRYNAVVMGKPPTTGMIETPIEGKASTTRFNTLQSVPSLRSEWLTLVDLFPETGRTHQLRIHLSESGFPILGDKLYGTEGNILKHKGLFLCAVEISFLHPIHQTQQTVIIETPKKFRTVLNRAEKLSKKYGS
jgi:23S rRNA pseudouridine1911/1915/1917 synthase